MPPLWMCCTWYVGACKKFLPWCSSRRAAWGLAAASDTRVVGGGGGTDEAGAAAFLNSGTTSDVPLCGAACLVRDGRGRDVVHPAPCGAVAGLLHPVRCPSGRREADNTVRAASAPFAYGTHAPCNHILFFMPYGPACRPVPLVAPERRRGQTRSSRPSKLPSRWQSAYGCFWDPTEPEDLQNYYSSAVVAKSVSTRRPFPAVGGSLGRSATAPRILPCGSLGGSGSGRRHGCVHGALGAARTDARANRPAQQALGIGELGDSDRTAGPRRGNHPAAAGRGMGGGAAEGQADGGGPC